MIAGRADVGDIVFTPLPGILKLIVSVPAAALASSIACRKLPAPLSLVLVTVKIAAGAAVSGAAAALSVRLVWFVPSAFISLLAKVCTSSKSCDEAITANAAESNITNTRLRIDLRCMIVLLLLCSTSGGFVLSNNRARKVGKSAHIFFYFF